MRTFALAIAALAIAGFAAPTIQSANAETVVIKKHRDHDRDWDRRHHKKVVIIKHRDHDRDWDRRHHKKVVIIKHRGDRDRDHDRHDHD